ncbi:MAG: helix-hairpin-helix domain-containing protein [Lachnospiraceae bacterium]
MKMIQRIELIVPLLLFLCVGCGKTSMELVPIEDLPETDAVSIQASTEMDASIAENMESVSGEESGADSATGNSAAENNAEQTGSQTGETSQARPEYVYVFVSGSVNCPGVYELYADSRLYEAVQMAGGFSAEADTNYCNLAQVIADGAQYYFPTKEEVDNGDVPFSQALNNSSSGTMASEQISTESGSYDAQGRLNINQATEQELCTLPGIGTTRAEAILAYREEHGNFTSIEDLMNVSGIKQGTFDQLKDQITVNNE